MSRKINRRLFVLDSTAALIVTAVGCGGGGGGDATAPSQPRPGGDGPAANTPGVTVSGNTITVNLTIQSGLTAVNASLLILEAKTFVINLGNDQYRAFTSVCTHEACDVDTFSGGRIRCPCHGSQYDVNGGVVVGPAPAALRRFTTNLSGTTLTIVKS